MILSIGELEDEETPQDESRLEAPVDEVATAVVAVVDVVVVKFRFILQSSPDDNAVDEVHFLQSSLDVVLPTMLSSSLEAVEVLRGEIPENPPMRRLLEEEEQEEEDAVLLVNAPEVVAVEE